MPLPIETEVDFSDIIPWEYSSNSIDDDAKYIQTITEEPKLSLCLSSRKGWLSRALNRVTNDKEYDTKFNIRRRQTHNRYKETLHFLEERFGKLVNGYRRYLQLFPLNRETTYKEFEKHSDTYYECREILDQLLDKTDPNQATTTEQKTLTANTERGVVPKAAGDLKPDVLTEMSMPQTFTDWSEKLQIYLAANNLLNRPTNEQMQYARSFMSPQLWQLARDHVTPTMPVFMEKNDTKYVKDEMNCLIDILEREFLRIHPTITRRIEIFRKKQRPDQSFIAFISELKRDALAANLQAIKEEDILCILLLNGLNNENLRREILDAFDIEKSLSIADIEHEIRKWEANRRTDNYVQGKTEVFAMTAYRRQKHQARRPNPKGKIICRNCGKVGHTSDTCYSKQNYQEGQSQPMQPPPYQMLQQPPMRGMSYFRPEHFQYYNYENGRDLQENGGQDEEENVTETFKPHYRRNTNIIRALTHLDDQDQKKEDSGRCISQIGATNT